VSIQERQNALVPLRRMASARRSFSVAKRWRFVGTLGTIALVALAPLALKHDTLRDSLAIATPIWLVISIMVLSPIERHYRGIAVRLLDQFDRMVFVLDWNGSFGRRLDELEVVQIHRRTTARQRAAVQDWYPVDSAADGVEVILCCQRGNLTWARRLHHLSRWLYLIAGLIGAAYGVGFAIAFKAHLETYLVGVVLPSVPGLLLVFESFVSHSAAGRERFQVETNIDDLLRAPGLNINDAASTQDRIFELRAQGPPIPDLVYYATRNGMNQSLRDALATPGVALN